MSQIDFTQKKDSQKEERIKAIIADRGGHPGLVHIVSAMEPCPAHEPWHDKKAHKTLVPRNSCLFEPRYNRRCQRCQILPSRKHRILYG